VLVTALAGASCAIALADSGNGRYGVNSVAQHGKQPVHHGPAPIITRGPLPAPSPIAPITNRSFAVAPKRGRILVRPGGPHRPATFIPVTGDTSLPLGAVIDATHGVVALTVARDVAAKPQVVELTGGLFVVRQHGRNPITDIVLTGGDFSRCARVARRVMASAAVARRLRRSRHRVVRQLWARDDHGRFTTYGLTSVATVRGTVWLTQDRCDGTLTRVLRGRVLVRDRVRRRTVVLTAGREYLAKRGR
jgi:hypothetical protein